MSTPQPSPRSIFNYDDQDAAGDSLEGVYRPPDEPMGSHSYGTTSAEERHGETFQQREHHTYPELTEDDLADPVEPVGHLVQPGDQEIGLVDDESNTVATDEGDDDDDLSAEEAAMHTTDLG